jgi:hypothetical protein
MNELQFDFNPFTPVPQPDGGGKFPWTPVFIGISLLVLLCAIAYAISPQEEEEEEEEEDKIHETSAEEPSKD